MRKTLLTTCQLISGTRIDLGPGLTPGTEPLPDISTQKSTHRLIKHCRAQFKGATKNNYGRLVTPSRKDLDVSRPLFTRALSLLNTIVHIRQALEHTCTFSEKLCAIEFHIHVESLTLSIAEKATRIKRKPTQNQREDKSKYG